MIDPARLVSSLKHRGLGPLIGVPCSYLSGVIAVAESSDDVEYIIANNEGEAVAIAAGLRLTGARPVVLMQNSGLGNAINPLTSLLQTLAIPVLMLITWRGEPGRDDEPQHRLMGAVTRDLLDLAQIRNDVIPADESGLEALLDEAIVHLTTQNSPFALIVPMKTIGPGDHRAIGPDRTHLPTRAEVIDLIVGSTPHDAAIVATTGKTARELEAIGDRAGNLYVVGSMGCASSIALGVALGAPHRPVVVIDGDGAALMRMESMATIGRLKPANLTHLLLDNAAYESTGGQATGSPHLDFLALARACGYPRVRAAATRADIKRCLGPALRSGRLSFAHFSIRSGSDPGLGRPALAPPQVADRFQAFVR